MKINKVQLHKEHPCPTCGAPGIEVCLGCGKYSDTEQCDCPAGTGFVCSDDRCENENN